MGPYDKCWGLIMRETENEDNIAALLPDIIFDHILPVVWLLQIFPLFSMVKLFPLTSFPLATLQTSGLKQTKGRVRESLYQFQLSRKMWWRSVEGKFPNCLPLCKLV